MNQVIERLDRIESLLKDERHDRIESLLKDGRHDRIESLLKDVLASVGRRP